MFRSGYFGTKLRNQLKRALLYNHSMMSKGPLKLIEWVKITILFLHVLDYDFEFFWVVLHPHVK